MHTTHTSTHAHTVIYTYRQTYQSDHNSFEGYKGKHVRGIVQEKLEPFLLGCFVIHQALSETVLALEMLGQKII